MPHCSYFSVIDKWPLQAQSHMFLIDYLQKSIVYDTFENVQYWIGLNNIYTQIHLIGPLLLLYISSNYIFSNYNFCNKWGSYMKSFYIRGGYID